MNHKICKNCDHYIQHYVYSKMLGMTDVSCGFKK